MSLHVPLRSVPVVHQSTEYCDRLGKVLDEVMQSATSVAEDLQDTDSEKYSSHVEAISSQMEGFAQLVHEVKLIKSAVREVEGCITSHNTDEAHFLFCIREEEEERARPPPDLAEVFDGRLKELREDEEYDPKTHPRVEEYYRRLREAYEEEEEEDMDTQEDGDLVVGQVKKSLHCPLTKKFLDDPVTSQQCKHSYSRAAILEHIRKRNNPKCPVCNAPIRESDLKTDEKLQQLVRKEKRKQGRGRKSNKQSVVQL